MQLKQTKQSEKDQVIDRVYIALETGNINQARTLFTEYAAVAGEDAANALHMSVLGAYGVTL